MDEFVAKVEAELATLKISLKKIPKQKLLNKEIPILTYKCDICEKGENTKYGFI